MNSFFIWFLIIAFVPLVVFLAIFIPVTAVKKKYESFIFEHSLALRRLSNINARYKFYSITPIQFSNSYDNEVFYSKISCKDYLIYRLIYEQSSAKTMMKNAAYNRNLFIKYKEEISNTCHMDQYDTTELLKNRERLKKTESELFAKEVKTPIISFFAEVRLTLTNINSAYRASKRGTFAESEIEDIIRRLSLKRGNYYLDKEIWDAICRVERGKVTNRMRFAVYERDHYRCRKCGRRTNDLEVDHIIPIAKGGKSTFSNLQTLCHRCNYNKGSNIEF